MGQEENAQLSIAPMRQDGMAGEVLCGPVFHPPGYAVREIIGPIDSRLGPRSCATGNADPGFITVSFQPFQQGRRYTLTFCL